jgi:hypothetical protein
MTFHRLSFAVVIAIASASCSDPAGPAATGAPGAEFSQVPGHHVNGSGHVQSATGLREFTFHAAEAPDGSVRGSYKVVLASGLFFEADVSCMSVAGSTGWVAGVIRATNAAAVVVGSRSTFFAIDGGEGDGAVDVVSNATFNGGAGADLAFCADQPLALPQLTVTDGNVQVR